MAIIRFGRRLPPLAQPSDPALQGEDWQQANPKRIEGALQRALQLPAGGWYVVDGVRAIGDGPRPYRILGRDLVAWRGPAGLMVAPDACPHMGAPLSCGQRSPDGAVACPWHGLKLGPGRHGRWQPLPTHDDGILLWVQLPTPGEEPSDKPFYPPRPDRYLDGVVRMEARCDPENVLENRLDPWHGAHFHPYAFAALRVTALDDACVRVRVARRLLGPICMEVDATFHCSDRRTIVMTIVEGEGVGSTVETHATPIEPGRTAVIEATIATSERIQFRLAELAAPLVRPLIRRSARRLWVDDIAYAEQRYRVDRLAESDSGRQRVGASGPSERGLQKPKRESTGKKVG